MSTISTHNWLSDAALLVQLSRAWVIRPTSNLLRTQGSLDIDQDDLREVYHIQRDDVPLRSALGQRQA